MRRNEYLLSPENLRLAPQERLQLLIDADYYPIVTKRTATNRQIKEMKNLYNFLSIALADFLGNNGNEFAYFAGLMLEISGGTKPLIGTSKEEKCESAISADNMYYGITLFKDAVDRVDLIEKRLKSIRNLFFEYFYKYPDICEEYQLLEFTDGLITDIPENIKRIANENPKCITDVFKYWGIELKREESSN